MMGTMREADERAGATAAHAPQGEDLWYWGDLDLRAVLDYIEQNCADATLEGVAAHFGYHPNSLTRVLRKGLRSTFREELVRARVRCAHEALRAGATVARAARVAGYHSVSHFNDRYRAAYGVTPGEYRRSVIDEAESRGDEHERRAN